MSSARRTPLALAAAIAVLLTVTSTAAMADLHEPADGTLIRIDLNFESEPVEAGQGFYVQHGWIFQECEDGQPVPEDQERIDNEDVRWELSVEDEAVAGAELVAGCVEVDTPGGEGTGVHTLKQHRYTFADGLAEGTYTFTGDIYGVFDGEVRRFDLPSEPFVLEVVAAAQEEPTEEATEDAPADEEDTAEEVEQPVRVDTGGGGTAGTSGLALLAGLSLFGVGLIGVARRRAGAQRTG